MSTSTLDIPNFGGLPDLCAATLATAVQLRDVDEPKEDFEAFRARIKQLLADMESRAQQDGVPQQNIHLCKYALVALVDEVVLQSAWSFKDQWMGNPLQLEFFNDFNAGEEFYHRLDDLRHADDERTRDVLEVYYLCLVLGFMGKFADRSGLEKRATLIEGLARELSAAHTTTREGLSPAWKPQDVAPAQRRQWPMWVAPLVCVGFLTITYLTLSWILDGSVTDLLEALTPQK